MKRYLAPLLLALCMPCGAHAQYTQVIAAHIVDASGIAVPDGSKLCATTTDAKDIPAGYRAGSSGGQVVGKLPACTTITGGTISGYQVIDTSQSYPQNACVRFQVFDPSGVELRRDKCVQPSGEVWNYDAFATPGVPNAIVQIGPAPNIAAGIINTGSAGSSATVSVSGSNPNYLLNMTIPKGDKGDPGTTTASGTNGDWVVPGKSSVAGIASFGKHVVFSEPGSAYGYGRAVQLTPIMPGVSQDICGDGLGNQIACGSITGSTVAGALGITVKNNFANLAQWSDGLDMFRAAPGYVNSYSDDTTLAMWGLPQAFTSYQIRNIIDKFLSRQSDGSGANGNTSVAGELPMCLDPSGATNTANGACGFYSAWDNAHIHATGDGSLMIPILEGVYVLNVSGDDSHFLTVAARLKLALNTIPRDAASGCPYVAPGQEWVTWGFQEAARKTGVDAMGCVLYYAAAATMATMYGRVGDTTNQSYFQAQVNTIKSYFQNTSSALWDAADGMYYAATIQNKQIDVIASSLAVYLGLASSTQSTAISNWLASKYSVGLVDSNGYANQSDKSWTTTGYIPASGGPPYSGALPSACYQSANWSVGNRWIEEALYITRPDLAVDMATKNINSADPTMEYWAPSCASSSGWPAHGFTKNLESPIGSTAFALAHPYLFTNGRSDGLASIGSIGSAGVVTFGSNYVPSPFPSSDTLKDPAKPAMRWAFVGASGASGQVLLQYAPPSTGGATWQTISSFSSSNPFLPQKSVSAAIGGSALAAGQCVSGTATGFNGLLPTTIPKVSPMTAWPDRDGGLMIWQALPTSATTVTVRVCAIVAGTPISQTYSVEVE